eukprot:s700_g19.t1
MGLLDIPPVRSSGLGVLTEPAGDPQVLNHQAQTPQRQPPLMPREAGNSTTSAWRLKEAALEALIVKVVPSMECSICCEMLQSMEVVALPCETRGCGCTGFPYFASMAQETWRTSMVAMAMAGAFEIDHIDHQDSDPPVGPVVSPVRSERSLTPKVPAEIVQGVPCRCLLAGGGRPFRPGKAATRHVKRCSGYNIFVSHDWRTSGWLKYASLLVLLNSGAAFLATLIVSLALGLLVAYEVLPNYSWLVSIGYLTFAVFFFFWQHIRDTFFAPKLAFLDKLCIPQDDEEVKEKCILGLAGFLRRSGKLVILFSESYISRLWCIYEITAFMRMHSSQVHIDMQTVPVVLPLLILLHAAWWLAVRLLTFLIWQTSQTNSTMNVLGVVVVGLVVMFLITYPLQAWVGRRLTKNLQSLSRQLREFDVHESKCSCCSAGHERPSGERIPCDRDLIYQSLADWYGNDADDLQGRLESFNKAVRTQFADRILSTWEEQSMPVKVFIYNVFSMNTPFLIIRIPDAIRQAQQQPSAFLAGNVAITMLIVGWGYIWPAMLFQLWACKTMWTLTLKYNQCRILMEAGAAVFVLLSWGIVAAVCVFSVLLHRWAPLLVFVSAMALGLYLLGVFTLPKPCRKNTVDKTQTECDTQEIRDDMSSFSI